VKRPSRPVLRWLFFALRWLLRLAMVPLVARQHRPRVALAWLTVIFSIPWLGPPLYFLFGEYGLRRSVRRHARIHARLEQDERVEEEASWALRRPEDVDGDDDVWEMVRLVDRMTKARSDGLPILGGNRVELLNDTDDAIEALVAAIDGARHHAHLLFFIFNPDETGKRVADALVRAARRGVACRVLADDYGSGREADVSFFDTLGRDLLAAGVAVERMLPVRQARRPFARFDIRNHRKLAVIDGRVAFAGSLNLHGERYALSEGTWKQLTARLEGPAVHQLQILFVEDWHFATGELLDRAEYFPEPEERGSVCVQTVAGGPTYESDFMEELLIAALNRADHRVIAAAPYFVPTEAILIALRLAALRGVRVQLVVPLKSDRMIADCAARAFFDELLTDGVEIYRHEEGLLHSKAMAVDDRFAIVGSANFDRRSFYINYELALVLYGHDVARQVRDCLESYVERSTAVDLEAWRQRHWAAELIDQTAKLASPLL
jgi:cardiolipin synthase A/B